MTHQEISTSEHLVSTVLTELHNGQIRDAIGHFAEEFKFIDRGIGLDFDDKLRLEEFFRKTRELHPDSVRQIRAIFVSGTDVIAEWTLRDIITEPSLGAVLRRMHVLIHGVTVVRTKGGKIAQWSEYYDGLTARRTALSAYFTDWVEL